MNLLSRIDLDLFMLIVCIIMYITNLKTNDRYMTINKIFRSMIISTMVLLALEVISWVLDGRAGTVWHILNCLDETLLYILTPMPALLWALYVNWSIFQDSKRLKREMQILAAPFVVCGLLSISTPWTGWMFIIDAANIYRRGDLFPLMAAVAYLPLLYAAVMAIIHKKRISRRLLLFMLMFMAAPVIGATLQVIFYGTTLLWSSITISIFIIHTNVQNQQVYMDYLTDIYNRRQADAILTDRIKMTRYGKSFSCAMLDIDNFKSINDKLGHTTGDDALKEAAQLLKSCIRKGDCLARYAGDEFIILADIGTDAALKELAERIRTKTIQYNKTGMKPYTLSFSIGYTIYDPASSLDKDGFVAYVDALMYQDKNSKNIG